LKLKNTIMQTTTNNNNLLGFTSIKDVFTAVFTDFKKYNMNTLLLFGFLSLFIVTLLETWLWSPLWSLAIFSAVFFIDFILAVMAAVKTPATVGGGFQTNKAVRFIVSLVFAWCVLGLLHNLPKLNDEFAAGVIDSSAFEKLATAAFLFWLFFNFLSAIRHASKLGFLPKPVAAFFIKYIDAHKNMVSRGADPTAGDAENKGDSNDKSGGDVL
jgi:hypothetical protein